MNSKPLAKILYFIVLTALSCAILVAFLQPTDGRHSGLNEYPRAKFLEMVEGKAHRPYVYRTLLPTTVRAISGLVPDEVEQAWTDRIEADEQTRELFAGLGWETRGAFRYLAASALFLLCFMGFGHCAVRLTERVCELPESGLTRLLLVLGVMTGLPPMFRYVSYPYDPAQLFLFTLALFMLATRRARAFAAVFVLCCLNKETAVLLIPLFALAYRPQPASSQRYRSMLLSLVVVFVGVKVGLAGLFRGNPGGFLEFQLAHNLKWLAGGWTFPELIAFLVLAGLVFFRWAEKPIFLKQSFLWVLAPLVGLALFLGYVDEWRGYYEAYPLAFGLIVHSIVRFNELYGARSGTPAG